MAAIEIFVAAKSGGPDIDSNATLRLEMMVLLKTSPLSPI